MATDMLLISRMLRPSITSKRSSCSTGMPYFRGASYDLGGAEVVGGVERGATGNTRADLGVSFSF